MAIVVVGGNIKDAGKTALVCGIISAFRELNWTVVKITGHSYETKSAGSNIEVDRSIVWEETNAGKATDTARYLDAGARRALLVNRRHENVPIEQLRKALGNDRNVLYESNRIVDVVRPDVCLALVAKGLHESKPSFLRLLQVAGAVVTLGEAHIPGLSDEVPVFAQRTAGEMSEELVQWLRTLLSSSF